ncbi:hypothetical protein IAU60_005445 [Kwoniella sp. DSM 27419]
MSRRRTTTELFQPTRRILRFCALSVLIIAGVWVISSQTNVRGHGVGAASQKGDEEPVISDDHPVDNFVKSFPRLRSHAQTEPLRARASIAVDGVETVKELFDWPRTKKLFVFKDYRKNGVDGGHHQQFVSILDLLQYWNFAKPGATVSHSVLPPGLESYGTFETQIKDFEDLFTPAPGPKHVNWNANDSLFVVFFGINDMRDDLHDGEGLDIPSTTKSLADYLMRNTRRLHAAGARSFLFLTLPPIQYSPKYNLPSQVGHDIQGRVERSVQLYNEYVRAGVAEFEADTPDANVMLFDLERYWKLVLDYPELFGMTDCARFHITVDGRKPNLGRMGLCYHDNQHISWSSAALIARAVNGCLLRSSASFQVSNATETAIEA